MNLEATNDLSTTVSQAICVLKSRRFALSTEKHLQLDIEQVFAESGIRFEREKQLSPGDIPDFIIEQGVIVECKIKGKSTKMNIYRQLCRYAQHGAVKALILVSNISMGMPEEINGKPVYVVSLSAGWM